MTRVADLQIIDGTGHLVLRGEIDLMVIDELRAVVAAAQEQHITALDVDLSLVDFIDSSGLGVIAQAAADFERLRVVAAPISIIRILEMTGLGGYVSIQRI